MRVWMDRCVRDHLFTLLLESQDNILSSLHPLIHFILFFSYPVLAFPQGSELTVSDGLSSQAKPLSQTLFFAIQPNEYQSQFKSKCA